MSGWDELPATVAYHHRGEGRAGFEVVFPRAQSGDHRLEGRCTAIVDGEAHAVAYAISVDEKWVSRHAEIETLSAHGAVRTVLEHDGRGGWSIDGIPAPAFAGCLDVDLEASSFTNTLAVRRLSLGAGEEGASRAAWVRAAAPAVDLLEQGYVRLPDRGTETRFRYRAPQLDFEAELVFDRAGLIVDYPGIAVRAA